MIFSKFFVKENEPPHFGNTFYFHHIFDIIGEIEDDEKEEDDLDYMFMLYILNAFLDAYYK